MAIPETIKKLANDIRTKIYGREVREALAQGIEAAGDLADKANTKSENVVYQVNNIQAQVNQLVVEGDSSVEAAQARVDAEGNVFATLKERLDVKETFFARLISNRDYVGYGEIKLPWDFPKLPFSLYRDRDGRIKHTFDFWQFENYTKVLYVDSITGGDANDGSQSSPFKSLKKALQTASALADTNILIRVKGPQLRGYGGDDALPQPITTITNKKISIVPDGSEKIVVANAQSAIAPSGLTLTWTADGNAWKTARSQTYNVFDLNNRDVFGVAKPLEYVSSVSLCQSTPNSWYTDGTNVWVHTFDGRQPDEGLIVCVNVANFWLKLVNSTLYMRDLEFYSGCISDAIGMYGSCFIEGDFSSKLIANKCFFAGGEARDTGSYIPYNNGIQVLNTKEVYMFECVAAYTRRDGFNYHYYNIPSGNRRNCLVFEFACVGYENGRYDTNGNNNATTAHEGVSTLRIGPIGYGTNGPVLADVNGCYSIIYDGSMRDSKIASAYDASSAYYFDNVSATTPGKAILINCEGSSPKYSIYADTGFDVRVRNFVGKKIKSDISLTYLD